MDSLFTSSLLLKQVILLLLPMGEVVEEADFRRLEEAEARYVADGGGLWRPFYRTEQAKAYLRRGDTAAAMAAKKAVR